MIIARENILRTGIYTPAEAARYARVKTRLMTRWVHGYGAGQEPVITAQLERDPDRTVTFLDFIQSLSVRSIRHTAERVRRQIPLQKIREAVKVAQETYGVTYPLARRHTIYIFGGRVVDPEEEKNRGSEVVIRLAGPPEKLVQLTGRGAGNLVMTQIAEPFMRDISYNDEGLAEEYCAYKRQFPELETTFSVTMNPKFSFGEPLLKSCGYTAQALWDAYLSEGSIEAAARVYDVSREEIETAISYVDYLQGAIDSE